MKALRNFAAMIPACAILCGFAAAVDAQSISFFQYEGFGGRQVSSDQSIPNFDPIGLNDAANAVIVRAGQWQLCTDAFFHGRCVTLSPGEYPNLGVYDMRNSVSSARLIDARSAVAANTVIPAPAIPPPQYQPPAQYQAPQYQPPPPYQPPQYQPPPRRANAQGAPVVLFEEYDFGGRSIPISARVDNLDITQWNDRAVSMVINEGNWELCTDAFYRGSCSVFGPGSYRDLGNGLVRQVSSLRPAAGGRYDDNRGGYIPPPPAAAPQPYYPRPARDGARAILFSDHDLRGGNVVIDGDLPNLDGTGFNDRASSIRVEGGYWMFCSDAGYRGDCRVFGPGDYPNLPDGFEGKISSVRRVAGPGG